MSDDNKGTIDLSILKQLMKGVAIYTGVYTLGPLIVFIMLGLVLDNYLNKKPFFLIVGVLVAFVTTNIFLFSKVKKLSKEFKQIDAKKISDNKK